MKNKLVNIFISATLAITTILIIPDNYLNRYKIEQISEKKKIPEIQHYYSDLDNDGNSETIEYIRKKSPGHSIDILRENIYLDLYNSSDDEFFMSENIEFADNDLNGFKEIYFISAYRNKAYLNILEFNEKSHTHFKAQKIFIDSIENYNDYPDIINYNIDFLDNNNIVFDLHAGFSVQPRKIYNYNSLTKKLKISPLNSIVVKNFKFICGENEDYILPTEVYASGNSISTKQKSDFEKSLHPDTIRLYNKYKNKVYKYGDFSSYTLLYNKDVDYVFPPIEHKGWTKNTFSDNIKINNKTHIISLTKSLIDSTFSPNLIIVNLKGEIVNKKELIKQGDVFMRLFVNQLTNNIIILSQKNNEILEYNNQLELIKKVKTGNNPYIYGFRDLENDNIPELITVENHKLNIYTNDLKSKREFPLHFCGQSIGYFNTFQNNKNTYIHFEIGDSSFVLYYLKNRFYYLKNFLHLAILILWYLFICFVQKLNSRRLESENIKLENIVKERIIELKLKNKELKKQKKEIHNQADKLRTVNEHLIELDKFKDSIIGMIVHDLKNPLNIIINSDNVAYTKQSGRQMLTMVQNILDVQKFEETQIDINIKNESVHLIAENALQQVTLLIEKKNLNIENNIPHEYGALSDIEKTTRIFINILTNAIKFTPNNGSIIINCDVTVKNNKKSGVDNSQLSFLKISVTDTGIGIRPDKLDKIFDKFEQISKKKSDEIYFYSTGLGLTFCKLAIEAQGGEIGVKSKQKKGSTFWFTLPKGEDINPDKDILPEKILKSELILTSSDAEYLQTFIDKLKKIEVYDISKTEKILAQIDSTKSKGITDWKNKMKNALFITDEDLFAELLKL